MEGGLKDFTFPPIYPQKSLASQDSSSDWCCKDRIVLLKVYSHNNQCALQSLLFLEFISQVYFVLQYIGRI